LMDGRMVGTRLVWTCWFEEQQCLNCTHAFQVDYGTAHFDSSSLSLLNHTISFRGVAFQAHWQLRSQIAKDGIIPSQLRFTQHWTGNIPPLFPPQRLIVTRSPLPMDTTQIDCNSGFTHDMRAHSQESENCLLF